MKPVSRRLHTSKPVTNRAGATQVYTINSWEQLDRFLILGTSENTYYATAKELTAEQAKNLLGVLTLDGKRVVDRIVEISTSGRAPKNDPALFALAVAATYGDEATKKYALSKLSDVARIGTHLFHFVNYIGRGDSKLRGWGRQLRTAVANWYLEKKGNALELQLTKYQSRDGWSHRDVIKLAHPKPDMPQSIALGWAVDSAKILASIPPAKLAEVTPLIAAYEEVKSTSNEKRLIKLITDYRLPMELIPTEKRSVAVYEAVLHNLNIEALIRQLPTLTKAGIFANSAEALKYAENMIKNPELLKKGRIHPIKVLAAYKTYSSGHSLKGDGSWTPQPKLTNALNDAFYLSFEAVEPTGKRFMLGVDVSGSMWWSESAVLGNPSLHAADVAAAMALATAKRESNYYIAGFDHDFTDLQISPNDTLERVFKRMQSISHGGTNASIPILFALRAKIPVDAFVTYTDNETWAGPAPMASLEIYRQTMGIDAKLIAVATSATNYSIADGPGTLNLCGFDSAAPGIISDFATNGF